MRYAILRLARHMRKRYTLGYEIYKRNLGLEKLQVPHNKLCLRRVWMCRCQR